MMEKEFIVLYTHQKQKKAKTWHDGVLKASCHSKKATLYDDKGSRLDSIYIKAEDITLGEQLESDRYYILVEEVKKIAGQDGSAQQQAQNDIGVKTLQSMPLSSDRRPTLLSSQGRCSGLKKKGFVPPRMNTIPRKDTDESSQLSQDSQLENDSQMRQMYSPCSESNFIPGNLNSRNDQRQNERTFSSLSMYAGGQNNVENNMATNLQNPVESDLLGRNLKSMASPIVDYMNQLKKVCFDSQDSSGSNRTRSPWSVYGSKNNSPLFGSKNNSPRTLNSTKNEGIERMDPKAVAGEPDSGVENPVNDSNYPTSRSTQNDSYSFDNRLGVSKAEKNQNVNESNIDLNKHTEARHKQVNENANNAFQSKRSMFEIMKLMKAKTDSFGTRTEVTGNKVQTESPHLQEHNENMLHVEQTVHNHAVLEKAADFETLNIEPESLSVDAYNTNDKSEKLSNSTNKEKATAIDFDSCGLSETEGLDNDGPSFAISFSPLSNVTYSDDESIQEDKIASKNVIGNTETVEIGNTVDMIPNETVSDQLSRKLSNAISQDEKQNMLNLDTDRHTDTPDIPTVYEDENSFKNENVGSALSEQCDKSTQETRIETTGTDPVHSSSYEGGLISKSEMTNTCNDSSEQTNFEEKKCKIMDMTEKRIEEKGNLLHENDKNASVKGNSATELLREDVSGADLNVDEISSEQTSNFKMNHTVDNSKIAENIEERIFENGNFNSDNEEESDFIDLIDNAENGCALEAKICDTNSVVSDKTVSGVSDRKTTQSQDTMDYSCDTMSCCSDSQIFSQSHLPEVPDISKFKTDESKVALQNQRSKISEELENSSESQEVSQQIPVISRSLFLGQKFSSPNLSASLLKSGHVEDNVEKPFMNQCDSDGLKAEHDEKHDRKNKPMKNCYHIDGEIIQPPQFVDDISHHEIAATEPQCESILTQIDNHHTANSYDRTLNLGPHHVSRRWQTLDSITNWQLNRVNTPVSEFPHPSELFGRKVKKKIRDQESSAGQEMWGRENVPPEVDEQPAELSAKINEKFRGYMFRGSLCSQVLKKPSYSRSQWSSQSTFSPNQRLSDHEIDGVSVERSPSLFEDDDDDRLALLTEKSKNGKCVFISDSESSKGHTPQLPGQESDDDYIYTQIYQHRPMVQDKGLQTHGNEMAGSETFGQRADTVPFDSSNTRVHDTHVNYCKENSNFEESSPDLFTQPRNMFDKQNHVSGGLYNYIEKQKVALVSEPIDDQVMHDNYQNSNLDLEETPFTLKEKRTFARNLSEFHRKVFDESQDSSFGYLETGSLDIKFGAQRNANKDKFVNEPWSGNENRNFICDNELTGTPNNTINNKERHFSDDLSLSSQEFAQVINKSLIPKTEQEASVTLKNMNSSSKWEKYESQQSEDDINLDIDAVKVKAKDFSVIEKSLKSKTVILPGKQVNPYTTQNTDVLNEKNQRNINTQYSATNERTNLNKRCVPQLPPVREETIIPKATHKNPVTQVVMSENSKLPSSFSSMDSFEQMLANDNLDFSDPELDKLLQTQNNIDKIEEKLIDLSPGSGNPKENSSRLDALDLQNNSQSGNEKVIKCKNENVVPIGNKGAIDSFEEMDRPSNSSEKKELQFMPCDKNEISHVENSVGDHLHDNDDTKVVELNANAAKVCDIDAVENCDRRIPDLSVKHSKTNNDNHTGVKSLSSESETSFSLDDSFMTSNPYNGTTKTKDYSKEPTASLRAPWKENVKVNSTKSISAIKENVTKTLISAIDQHKTNVHRSTAQSNEHHKSAITDTNKTNIYSRDNVRLDAIENRFHKVANFMGYDSDNDDDYDEFCAKNVNEIKEMPEVEQNERENAFTESHRNKKSNMFLNSNSNQQKTDSYDKINQPSSSVKGGVKSVSSQFKNPFKNPFKNGENSQQTANQGNRVTKRFIPPLQQRSTTLIPTVQRNQSLMPTNQGYSPPSSRLNKHNQNTGDLQAEVFSRSMCGEFLFPGPTQVQLTGSLVRQVSIPTSFRSAAEYKNILTAAVTEYLNLQLCDLAKKYHYALSKVDVSQLEDSDQGIGKDVSRSGPKSKTPACQCGAPAKVVQVKKQGPNNGRFFYACSGARNQQCKFFQWLDEAGKGGYVGGRRKISDPHALITHMKNQRIQFYSECSLISKYRESIRDKFIPKHARTEAMQKKQLYLKLSHKGQSSLYSKDDIWVVSQSLDFSSKPTFIARSTYFGPTSSNEVEIDPLVGYSPSNWGKDTVCHALLVGNASTELSCLDNIKDHINPQSPLVIPSLLNREVRGSMPTSGYQVPRMVTETNRSRNIYVHSEEIEGLVRSYIEDYHLNEDQAEAIKRVGSMFSVEKSDSTDSVLLIHGVFGAGKSFLLSVIVLFLVKVFQRNDLASPRELFPWKLLISSTTNVAVDRILQGLLELGFEDFIRVGSVKKIAKPILPYSVHGTGTDSQELKDFQEMLRSGELTNAEKQNVRQGIDKLRKGENKKKLAGVRVVGVTCASCLAACISKIQFPVVMLDECSQMTEPSSLLPIARFGCEKLLLVGDPKQLDPTIQGSEAANENGLEQTMFDRLIKMGYIPTLLRTQYRCHPDISAASNKLFYSGMLIDGITAENRAPLLPELSTICLYDVDRGQECCEMAGSFYNEHEAQFVVFLIQFMLSCDIEPSSVGVITLYRSQMARITDLLNTGLAGENKEIKGVQVSTVDAFQGGERDIIILSTVRTQASGFIDNDKRTNVALTRARHHLLIVGHYGNLSRNSLWQKILEHCRGFQNGIQSADEARQQLESVLERLKEDKLLQDEEIHSSKTSQESIKQATKKRKPSTKRKRKKEESSENSPALSGNFSNGSNGTENRPALSGSVSNSLAGVENMDRESMPEPMNGKRKRSRTDGEVLESPQFSLSKSSGDSIPVISETETVSNAKSSRKKSRLSDRLNPDLFEDDTKDSSDDDLIHFSL